MTDSNPAAADNSGRDPLKPGDGFSGRGFRRSFLLTDLNLPKITETLPQEINDLLNSTLNYDAETSTTVRLIPTEGLMSPLQKLMFLSVQHERYLHAPPENHKKAIRYPDIKRLQDNYQTCQRALKELFKADFALPDFLSGLQAMLSTISALTAPGDLVLSISSEHGGHECLAEMNKSIGRISAFLPFDCDRHVIDTSRLDPSLSPKVIYLDHSNILHPHNLPEIKKAYPEAILVQDLSQILALIGSDVFPNPLQHGADIIVGSTHKSMNGPQKGIALTNRCDLYEKLDRQAKIYVSNNHPASVAALAACLLEFQYFGKEMTKNMVANANKLGKSLLAKGIPVYYSPTHERITDTQHIWIDCAKIGWKAEDAVQMLYRAGIVVNTLYLARGGRNNSGERGLRLGSTEVTRLGMVAKEMELIAAGIAQILLGQAPAAAIAKDMEKLRIQFRQVKYCFDIPEWIKPDFGTPGIQS